MNAPLFVPTVSSSNMFYIVFAEQVAVLPVPVLASRSLVIASEPCNIPSRRKRYQLGFRHRSSHLGALSFVADKNFA